MKAITIKQPWASLICEGIKDIENRKWKTEFRGRVLIHASAKPDKEPYMIFTDDQFDFLNQEGREAQLFEVFDYYKNNGAIIGSVEIVDCTINHPSIWAERHFVPFKPYNWVLANPILFDNPIRNVKGRLSFWDYESEDFEECTSCDKKFPMEIMEDDSAGNWFCPECWKELAPVMAEEYKNCVE